MNSRYSLTQADIVDEEEIEEEEVITAKIPVEKFFQINNVSPLFDGEISSLRIILLAARSDYITYFGRKVYAVYLTEETHDEWVGKPVKNPQVGLMKWEKSKWVKIYGFTLSLTMQEDP